jgi:TonB family protein
MSDKQSLSSPMTWGLIALMLILLGGAGYVIKMILSDNSPRKKSGPAMVTLLKPPPAMEKEKPPEREPVKDIRRKEENTVQEKGESIDLEKREIINPGPSNEPQNAANDNTPAAGPPALDNAPAAGPPGLDNTPAGDTLGLDSEGKAGSDAFGLVAKKGGRSITAGVGGSGRAGGGSGNVGGSGSGKVGGGGPVKIGGGGFGKAGGGGPENVSLLDKFSWYTQIMKTEISRKVQKNLDENRGIPRGKLQTVVRVSVDSTGAVVQCQIIGSSGNHEMDEAVKQCLGDIKISEPPPEGMPQTMIIRVSSQS